jgi:hypothetical protein
MAMKLLKSIFVSIVLLEAAAVCAAGTHQSHVHAFANTAVGHTGHSEHNDHGDHGAGHGWGHHGHGWGGFYFSGWVPWYSPWYYGYGYPSGYYVESAAPLEYVEMNPPAPVADTPAASETAPGVWYYCKNPEGYYPYVKNCTDGWQEVPAQPPQ